MKAINVLCHKINMSKIDRICCTKCNIRQSLLIPSTLFELADCSKIQEAVGSVADICIRVKCKAQDGAGSVFRAIWLFH